MSFHKKRNKQVHAAYFAVILNKSSPEEITLVAGCYNNPPTLPDHLHF